MNNLSFKLELATKSLTSLHEIFSETYSSVVRDATLFRFKRSVEIFWRLLKDYLCVHEGFVCDSPKSCVRMAFKVGLITEEEAVKSLELIDLRLKSEHAYQEEIAEEIYWQVGDYWKLWMRFAGGLLKRLSRIFGVGRPKNKNEVLKSDLICLCLRKLSLSSFLLLRRFYALTALRRGQDRFEITINVAQSSIF